VIPQLGEAAALAASFSWSFCSIFFTTASQRLGASTVNRTRLALAVVLLGGAHWFSYGALFPQVTPECLFWLALSGLCAHVLGDGILYQAYILVGPRTALLVGMLTPVFATIMAWLFLGETLAGEQLGAMALVLGGVLWVIAERGNGGITDHSNNRRLKLGIALSLGNALFQAIALISAKQGMSGGFSPLSAVLVRMLFAMASVWMWAALRGQVRATFNSLRGDWHGNLAMIAGTITGPFVGASLSLVALQSAQVGVTSVLLTTSPVMLLPISYFLLRERVTLQAVAGTLLALLGVGMLMLR
jgi:drug/metabolite transporter (DMT)-like permease